MRGTGYITVALLILLGTVVANEPVRNPDEEQLIGVLQSDAPLFDKARACQQLAVVGGKKAVPALVALLGDEELGSYARFGLEPINDPSVDAALRTAMDQLKGRALAGVVNSIGVRRDVKAVARLRELVRDSSAGVVMEALAALGQIATDDAIDTLCSVLASDEARLRIAAADAALVGAERLLERDRRDAAVALYNTVRTADVPERLSAAATQGVILARGTAGLPLLVEQLRSDQRVMLAVAFRAAREVPGVKVTQALAVELERARPEVQVVLIDILVSRSDQDPAVRKEIAALAGSPALEVRRAALKALGKIGDVSDVAVLLNAEAAGGEEATIARSSLRALRGDGVDEAIITGMKAVEGKRRADLIGILADRRTTTATSVLLEEAGSKDEAAARAAFKALASLADPNDLPTILKLLVELDSDEVRRQAEHAVVTITARIEEESQRAQVVLAALDATDQVSVRCSLLRVLGRIANDPAYDRLVKAMDDSHTEIKDAALRALAAWPKAQAADSLLRIARDTQNDTHRTLALRGYMRLLGDMPGPPEDHVKKLEQVAAYAKRAIDRKLIFSALAGVDHPTALSLAANGLGDEEVRVEAALAAVQIASRLSGRHPQAAMSAMEQVLAVESDEGIRKQAGAVLRQVEELNAYLLVWEACGPFEQPGRKYNQLFDIPMGPEKPSSGEVVQWRAIPAGTQSGKPQTIDVGTFFGGEQRMAYLRTWVFCPENRAVRLDIGSDDGIKVWLNDALVHANNAARAAVPGSDKVDAQFRKGWNPVMVKLTQNVGPWELVVSVHDRDGKPIRDVTSALRP